MARKESALRAEEIAGGFATASKRVTIQYSGRERTINHILDAVRRDVLAKGHTDEEIENVEVYIKPEEQKVYYVVNEKIEGSVAF